MGFSDWSLRMRSCHRICRTPYFNNSKKQTNWSEAKEFKQLTCLVLPTSITGRRRSWWSVLNTFSSSIFIFTEYLWFKMAEHAIHCNGMCIIGIGYFLIIQEQSIFTGWAQLKSLNVKLCVCVLIWIGFHVLSKNQTQLTIRYLQMPPWSIH